MELLLFHNTAQPKVGNHDIRILSSRSKEQVLGLEISVNYTTIMDVLDGLQDGAHEAGGVTMSASRDCGDKRLFTYGSS